MSWQAASPAQPRRSLWKQWMTKMPAPPAPFALGATVRFLSDPNQVERVIECEWVPLDAPDHWRLTTTWMDHDGQHVRIGDAAEFYFRAELGHTKSPTQPPRRHAV